MNQDQFINSARAALNALKHAFARELATIAEQHEGLYLPEVMHQLGLDPARYLSTEDAAAAKRLRESVEWESGALSAAEHGLSTLCYKLADILMTADVRNFEIFGSGGRDFPDVLKRHLIDEGFRCEWPADAAVVVGPLAARDLVVTMDARRIVVALDDAVTATYFNAMKRRGAQVWALGKGYVVP